MWRCSVEAIRFSLAKPTIRLLSLFAATRSKVQMVDKPTRGNNMMMTMRRRSRMMRLKVFVHNRNNGHPHCHHLRHHHHHH